MATGNPATWWPCRPRARLRARGFRPDASGVLSGEGCRSFVSPARRARPQSAKPSARRIGRLANREWASGCPQAGQMLTSAAI